MSDDASLDVIRQVNDAVAGDDTATIAETLDPDVTWEQNIGTGSPEEGVYQGREDVMRLFARIVETWDYIRPEPHSIERVDEGNYHVKGDLIAKHPTSAAEISSPYEQRLEVRDGKLLKGSTMRTGEISL